MGETIVAADRGLADRTRRRRAETAAASGRSTLAAMAATVEKLLLAAPRGYCAGVDRAVQTVERALELYGAPVYVRKEIVHNKHVVEQLRERGAIFVDELDDTVPAGATTVFSAHGVSPAVHADAAAAPAADDRRDLPAGDQGPPRGGQVRLRGLHDRPHRPRRPRGGRGHDGRGARAHRPGRDRGRRRRARRSPTPSKIAYISQTTLSVDETRAIINRLREKFPAITGPRTDDICYATTNRQAAVKQMAAHCDLLLVIGSKNSSNSNRLVQVTRELGTDAHLIDDVSEIDEAWLEGRRVVGISSGASAPEELVQRLVDFFRDARDRAGRGVPGRPGGRPVHAPQGHPPGDGRRAPAA